MRCWTCPGVRRRQERLLVLDGVFLHRDELHGSWDLSVFLDVPFEVAAERMARRDGPTINPSWQRYVQGQRMYFAACAPWRRADLMIDNADLGCPRIVSGG